MAAICDMAKDVLQTLRKGIGWPTLAMLQLSIGLWISALQLELVNVRCLGEASVYGVPSFHSVGQMKHSQSNIRYQQG